MNSFETVISGILQTEGFWTFTNYRIDLSKDQKVKIGRPTSPRWDIDIVAYQPGSNLLRVVECKSYLDSSGVSFRGFDPSTGGTERYKLFNDEVLRDVIFDQLVQQMLFHKLIRPKPTIELCLAAGNIQASSVQRINSHFDDMGWAIFDIEWILERLDSIAAAGYDDSIVSIVAKLLARKPSG